MLCLSLAHVSKVCLAVGQHSHMAGLQRLSAGCALLLAELCCRSAHCILQRITKTPDGVCMQGLVTTLCIVRCKPFLAAKQTGIVYSMPCCLHVQAGHPLRAGHATIACFSSLPFTHTMPAHGGLLKVRMPLFTV